MQVYRPLHPIFPICYPYPDTPLPPFFLNKASPSPKLK